MAANALRIIDDLGPGDRRARFNVFKNAHHYLLAQSAEWWTGTP
ncbi:MAG TPA: hypothetical protein VFG00_15055 [Acidothermaceae bacterium]|nr:hypothetical protein [Acidothermaceae bacterium]